jgi:hypothetical protein
VTGILPAPASSPFESNPWKLFRNTTGETIPPFSILRITGAENFNGAIRITVAKPNATQYDAYMVNGPYAVTAGEDGVCTTLTQAGYLAYDSGDGTPALGESWGAKSGQWTAEKDVAGFFICGGTKATAGVNAVVAIQIAEPQIEQIIVRNNSGEEIPKYAVMRVTGVTIESGVEVHTVEKPNSTFKTRYIINSSAAIPIGEDGTGTWLCDSGPVLYNNSAGTPAVDEEWGAKTGQWSLEKNRPGFVITGGNENDGSLYWTRAKQHIVTSLKGKAGSGISKGATGSVTIWMGASGAEASTEYSITCSALGAEITAAKFVVVWFESGVWYVAPWECP